MASGAFRTSEPPCSFTAASWISIRQPADSRAPILHPPETRKSRATPLVWKTVPKATLAGKRNDYEYSVVEQLGASLPPEVKITLLPDRGFGDQKFYAILGTFGWDYVIRFRDCILVTDVRGATKPCPGSLARPPSSCRGAVVVVQSAEHGDRDNRSGERTWRAFTGNRNPLTDPLVRSSHVEVAQGVFSKDVP